MENRSVHRWRCMNCGEMADALICSRCGKESYTTSYEKNDVIKETEKTPKNMKQINLKSSDESNKAGFISEVALKRIFNSSAEQINNSISNVGNTIKILCCVFLVLFIVQYILFAVKYGKAKSDIVELQQINSSISSLINSQNEEINNLRKTIEENENAQIKYIAHTVREGETLIEICREHNIEFQANKGIICSLNGIESPSNIQVGQVLLLPDLK